MKQYHVVLEKLCACAKKHTIEQIRNFNTKEEAEDHSYEWADTLNNTFCGKHGFDSVEVNDNFVISVQNGGFMEPYEI